MRSLFGLAILSALAFGAAFSINVEAAPPPISNDFAIDDHAVKAIAPLMPNATDTERREALRWLLHEVDKPIDQRARTSPAIAGPLLLVDATDAPNLQPLPPWPTTPQASPAPLTDPSAFVAQIISAVANHQWTLLVGLLLMMSTVGLLAIGKRYPWFQSRTHHMLLVWMIDSLATMSALLLAPNVKFGNAQAVIGMILTSLTTGAVMSGVAAAIAHYIMPAGSWSGSDAQVMQAKAVQS